jgi:hypothetical protein
MTLSSTLITMGLVTRGIPSGTLNTGRATLGALSNYNATAADVFAAIQIVADAPSGYMEINLSTGQADGSIDATSTTAGLDFQANDLPVSGVIHALRLRPSGTGTVSIEGLNDGDPSFTIVPKITLNSGSDIILRYPTGGAAITSLDTLKATFSSTGGTLLIEILSQV